MKYCPKCEQKKSLDEFYANKNTSDKKQTYCKACLKKMATDHHRKNRPYCIGLNKRWVLKNKYGITLDQMEQMFINQNGRCVICLSEFQESKEINIDHNHQTGKVRALLCHSCNVGLGYFKDNPLLTTRATEYLQKWNK